MLSLSFQEYQEAVTKLQVSVLKKLCFLHHRRSWQVSQIGATTLSIMGLVMTLSIDIQLNSVECHYAECRDYLNVMLSFLAPAKLFVLGETFGISLIFYF